MVNAHDESNYWYAEQNGIEIYCQDTDSIHLKEDDVTKLAKIDNEKNHQSLPWIRMKMTQFYRDFDAFDGEVGDAHSRTSLLLLVRSHTSTSS